MGNLNLDGMEERMIIFEDKSRQVFHHTTKVLKLIGLTLLASRWAFYGKLVTRTPIT